VPIRATVSTYAFGRQDLLPGLRRGRPVRCREAWITSTA